MTEWKVNSWGTKEPEPERLDTAESGAEETNDKIFRAYREKTTALISRVEEIGLPKPKEQIRLVTKRSFNAIAFIQHITNHEVIEHAYLVVFSFNWEAARIMDELLMTRRIKKATILMSNMRNMGYREKEKLTKEIFVNNPYVTLMFAHSHAKIISLKTEAGNYYTIEGSGNLSWTGRIEQYVMDNDRELYEFTMEWMQEMRIFLQNKKDFIWYDEQGNEHSS